MRRYVSTEKLNYFGAQAKELVDKCTNLFLDTIPIPREVADIILQYVLPEVTTMINFKETDKETPSLFIFDPYSMTWTKSWFEFPKYDWCAPPGICLGDNCLYIYGTQTARETKRTISYEAKFECFDFGSQKGKLQEQKRNGIWTSLSPIPANNRPSVFSGKLIYVEKRRQIFAFGMAFPECSPGEDANEGKRRGFIYDIETDKWGVFINPDTRKFRLHKWGPSSNPLLLGDVMYMFSFCEEESKGVQIIGFDCLSEEWKLCGSIHGVVDLGFVDYAHLTSVMNGKIGLFDKIPTKDNAIILDKRSDGIFLEKREHFPNESSLALVLRCLDSCHLIEAKNPTKMVVHVWNCETGKIETEMDKGKICTLWPSMDWDKFSAVDLPMKGLFDMICCWQKENKEDRKEEIKKRRKQNSDDKSKRIPLWTFPILFATIALFLHCTTRFPGVGVHQ